MENFDEHFEEYNMVANLLAENSRIFIQEYGRTTGSFYRYNSPDWSVILDAKEWTSEELELLHQVIDADGLIQIGSAHGTNLKFGYIYFRFWILNDNGYKSNLCLQKCITDNSDLILQKGVTDNADPALCALEQVEYMQKFLENSHYKPQFPHSYYVLPEYPGWFFEWSDASQAD